MPKTLTRSEKYAVPPELLPLVDGFLQRRRSDVYVLRDCIRQLDYSTIERIGHNLKGNGDAFGFPFLTEIGAKLEKSAKAANQAECADHIERLDAELAEIRAWQGDVN